MTAPATIRPQRTTAPPATHALLDAEILAGQLVWTLQQIEEHTLTDFFAIRGIRDALDAACDCQHRITTLQMQQGRG